MKLTPFSQLNDKAAMKWYVIDANGVVLGKLATKIANKLRGKDKPTFSPHLRDGGDHIIVINAEKIVLTGTKMDNKLYRTHSGYLGNMKETTAAKILERQPKRLIEEAVQGMLPKNKLRRYFMEQLHVYAGAEHKHAGQNPEEITVK